jgi:putative phage-type endonuclease
MDTVAEGRVCVPFGSLDRRTILGASEIAPVLGMSRFWTPLAIYLAKHREDAQMIDRKTATGPARWGNLNEPAIRQAYTEDVLVHSGHVLLSGDDVGTVLHPEHLWRAASPDGIVADPDSLEWRWGLECKNVDRSQAERWGETGSDQVPDEYALQCQWAMHITGLDRWDLAALFGGNDFRVFTLRRDDDLIANVVEAMDRFWNDKVLAGVPPEPMAEDNEILSRILKQRSQDIIENDAEIDRLAEAVRAARIAVVPYTDALNLAEAQLKVAIGDRAGASGAWGRVSFKQNKPTAKIDWEAVARDAGASDVLIATHTTERQGARPFRLTLTGEK